MGIFCNSNKFDAGPDGPSGEQRSFVQFLREDPQGIRARIEESIARRAGATIPRVGRLKLSSIYLPKIPPEQMWRVWYDVEGEEHYWFGAEIRGGDSVTAFVED